MDFNDVAIVFVKGSDQRIYFWYMSKDDAIYIMKNSDLKKVDDYNFFLRYIKRVKKLIIKKTQKSSVKQILDEFAMNNIRIVNKTTFLRSKNYHKLFGMLFHHPSVIQFLFLKKVVLFTILIVLNRTKEYY